MKSVINMSRCRSLIFSCAILYICCFSAIDGAVTTKASSALNKNGTKIRSNVKSPSKTTGKVITLRVGADGSTPEEQCQCSLFYQCDKDNTVDLAQNAQSCLENYVCCKLETPLITDNPVITETESTPGFSSGITDSSDVPPSNVTPNQGGSCRCVPAEQCRRSLQDQESGFGGIDVRKTCSVLELCCLPQYIIGGELNPISTDYPPSDTSTECGIRNSRNSEQIVNRIVSPEDTKNTSFGEFPWMALLLTTEISSTGERTDNIFVCGASIVSPKIVLTAAHCLVDVNQSLLKVRVGEYDTHADATKEPRAHQDKKVIKIVRHPEFNSKSLHNDLALVEVSEPFTFEYHINSVCIPLSTLRTYDYDPNNCVATGWGKNAFGLESQYPTTLKKVDLRIVPNDQCQEQLRTTRLSQYFILDSSFICAGGQPGIDTCEGDGGGPLVCSLRSNPNRYVQVGIVSWGIGCGNNIPAVYASLERNLEWLTTQYNTLISSNAGESKL